MITLTPEQFYKRIVSEGWKFITFHEGYVPNPKESRFYFFRAKHEDPNQLVPIVREALETYPAHFTIVAQRLLSGSAEPPVVCAVDSRQMQIQNLNGFHGAQNMRTRMTEEEMYQKVLADLKKEMELESLKNQLKAAQEKVEGFETGGKKLAFVGSEILWSMLKRNPKFSQAMQGFDSAEDVTDKTENKTETPPEIKDKAAVTLALNYCLKYLGEDSFIALAKKLNENPAAAETLKSFL